MRNRHGVLEMTVVVADTSPLNCLALIGEIGILRRLYGRVVVPSEVLAELAGSGAPPEVAAWIQSRPEWLEVRVVRASQDDLALQQLDPGERAAILLAQEEPMCSCSSTIPRVARKRTGVTFQTRERTVYSEPPPCGGSWIFPWR